jgi:hypothetical protein
MLNCLNYSLQSEFHCNQNSERVEAKELSQMQLSLLHPLGTMSHRVIEGGSERKKKSISIPESKCIE